MLSIEDLIIEQFTVPSCVVVSHFHLDHCGALPYMSEMVGYEGKIFMTHPTKAICPIMLVSYLIITVNFSLGCTYLSAITITNTVIGFVHRADVSLRVVTVNITC